MQNSRLRLMFFTIFLLLFISCSREDDSGVGKDAASTGILSFGTLLNNLSGKQANLKQNIDEIPTCSDDTPAFVELVLYRDGNPVVGTLGNAERISVNPNPDDNDSDGMEEYFTEASSALELEPGVYSLEYFTVLNAEEEVIWVSPRRSEEEGNLWNYVDAPLPFDIAIGAGVKKYVEVEVLCFDDRSLNDYGYLFFDLDGTKALEFCLFANYCAPDGIEYPAAFSVDFWLGEDATGTVLYSDSQNELVVDGDGVVRAEPLCFVIPDLGSIDDDEPYVYYEVTLLDWEEGYGEVERRVLDGKLSREDITGFFDGESNIDFEHLRFGCSEEPIDDQEGDCPGDEDCDGVADEDDLCPGKDDSSDNDEDGIPDGCDACPEISVDKDEDGDCLLNDEDPCPTDPENTCEEIDGDTVRKCGTAYMYGGKTLVEDNDELAIYGAQWGWAEFVTEGNGTYAFKIIADAKGSKTEEGLEIGLVNLQVDGNEVELEMNLYEGNSLEKARIFLSGKKPRKYDNRQFHYSGNSLTYDLKIKDYKKNKGFWIMIRADVCPAK